MITTSNHFQIEPLTDGVYAAISRDQGAAMSNAGIINLGDRTLIFDLMGTAQAARDLVHLAETITGNPVTLGVNSHWHPDHVLGNQELPGKATLISTVRTRELISSRMASHINRERQRIPRQLRQIEEQFPHETNIETRIALNERVASLRMLLHAISNASVRLPNMTFEQSMMVHGSARAAMVISFGAGHTESDTILYLPDDRIMFAGDLLFHQCHPWLGDGDPDAWLHSYDQIETLDPAPDVVVPGHGPLATLDAFADLRRYIPALEQSVEDVKRANGTADDAARHAIPAAFSAWEGSDTYQNNMRFLFERAAKTEAED